MRRVDHQVVETATPERLLRARSAVRVETFDTDAEERHDDGTVVASASGQRLRIEDTPLARLRSRSLLASGSNAETRSAVAGEAAERYYRTWFSAGLQPLRSPDMSNERVSGAQGGLLRTERQVANFHAFGRATATLTPDIRRVVDAVVLHEREPADIGRELSGYRQDKQATAVALYLLRSGLANLALHYGLARAVAP